MDERILSAIAYLDDFPEKAPGQEMFSSSEAPLSYGAAVALVRAMVQLEMTKRASWVSGGELSSRVALLESRMEVVMRTAASRRGFPVVQYVTAVPKKEASTPAAAPGAPTPEIPLRQHGERSRRLQRHRAASGAVSLLWLLAGFAAMSSGLHAEPFFALFFSTFGLYLVFAMKCREL
jgi:hypothetical protein